MGWFQSLSYLHSWQNLNFAGRHIFLCELCRDLRDLGVFEFFLRSWKLPKEIYCGFTNLKVTIISVCLDHHGFLLVLLLCIWKRRHETGNCFSLQLCTLGWWNQLVLSYNPNTAFCASLSFFKVTCRFNQSRPLIAIVSIQKSSLGFYWT